MIRTVRTVRTNNDKHRSLHRKLKTKTQDLSEKFKSGNITVEGQKISLF